jgi:exo-beta-1,3-glucanase (GH17 family)
MRLNFSQSLATTLMLLLLAAGSLCYWVLQGRAHIYPNAPSGKFACLSYTPNAGTGNVVADIHAQIDRDLQQLSKRTRCVRTYSVTNGLDYVPVAARRLGMHVLLGIWIGTNKLTNEQEIRRGIAIARQNADIIDAIIVGNEVLLRREQPVEELIDMLGRVRAATQLPVTYADVWDFWLKNPSLAEVSDFVSIHILPYWEDQPVGVDHAMAHVQAIFNKVQQAFPGKRIYVGETGWPSEGRQREAAKPSLLNQARFTRDFIVLANQLQLPYNFIEAYDQPWKRGMEGTVGGYWGLYDAQGREKFPLVGPVIPDTSWWRGVVAGMVVGLMLFGITRVTVRQHTPVQQLQHALAGLCLGCIGVMQWDYLQQSIRNLGEWLTMGSWTLIVDAIFLLLLLDIQHRYCRLRAALLLILLGSVAYINLGLVFDARYRDFPSGFLLMPVALLLVKGYAPTTLAQRSEALLLAVWLIMSSLTIGVLEGISNGTALLWCVLGGLTGLRLLFDHLRSRRTVIAHQ